MLGVNDNCSGNSGRVDNIVEGGLSILVCVFW